ncbi:antibiotic biosynthesis monooxygenase [Halieaceae bacterium IMCC14734]|uniref:Antibiotic biosynthesis monooxygenase n=1 Tax=Candidatus Litorirhabdus singularis TaxID=2518993 RepID=A0ABT3TLI4_9GAMM|nr:putative quinol monooxygenase [Candidatus Litorirhabdus singularis]MCX2982202.1 antibiotic biosynthesis monooxygenase [Candidatus Litorirhabdus singularis]
MLAFITNVRAKPGKREELMALTQTMQQATVSEEGVPVYVFHAAEDDPDELWFYELYKSEEAYAAHCATPEFQNMISSIADLGDIKVMHKLLPYGQVKGAGL